MQLRNIQDDTSVAALLNTAEANAVNALQRKIDKLSVAKVKAKATVDAALADRADVEKLATTLGLEPPELFVDIDDGKAALATVFWSMRGDHGDYAVCRKAAEETKLGKKVRITRLNATRLIIHLFY